MPTRPSPILNTRPLRSCEASSLFELTRSQGADLDAFAWRSRIQNEQDELAFIEWAHAAESSGQAWTRAIVVDGRLAGCASLYRPHADAFPEGLAPDLQLGYWLGRAFRGHGLAARAMALLAREVAPIFPADATLGVRCRSRNRASISCAERLGLTARANNLASQFDPQDVDVAMSGLLTDAAALAPSQDMTAHLGDPMPPTAPRPKHEEPWDQHFSRVVALRAPQFAQAVQGPLAGLVQALMELNEQGLAFLPTEIELVAREGSFLIFGDFLPAMLSSPACEPFFERDFLTLLLGAYCGALKQREPGRLDPFFLQNLSRESLTPKSALLHFLAQSCPQWIGPRTQCSLDSPRSHEDWLGDNELLSASMRPPDADPMGTSEQHELLWTRRRDQALALARRLGPCAASSWIPNGSSFEETRPALWKRFAQQAAALPALEQAAEIEKVLADPAATLSTPKRKILIL
jgi:RimJ/RimL family protein N-acetyltransferase/flagellar biosynthesis protein FliQ